MISNNGYDESLPYEEWASILLATRLTRVALKVDRYVFIFSRTSVRESILITVMAPDGKS